MTPKTRGGYDCEYFIKDHLGNNRVTDWDSAGVAVVQQENHYYPFGMAMQGDKVAYQNENQEKPNKYLYNGKEMQDDHGLDWLDYGARFYDAQLTRFHTVDPLTAKIPGITPYHYVFNNPMLFVDPTGMEPTLSELIQQAWDATPDGENRTYTYSDPPDYVLPSSPDDVDLDVWEPHNARNKGHKKWWKHKETGIFLAFDKNNSQVVEDPSFHLYADDAGRTRIDAEGNPLSKGMKSKNPGHQKPGTTLKIANFAKRALGVAGFLLDISSIVTDSPNNPLYIFQTVGTGEQNRAYIEPMSNQIYEWNYVNGTNIREVRTYKYYNYIDGEWRGVGLITKQYFDPNGYETEGPQ